MLASEQVPTIVMGLSEMWVASISEDELIHILVWLENPDSTCQLLMNYQITQPDEPPSFTDQGLEVMKVKYYQVRGQAQASSPPFPGPKCSQCECTLNFESFTQVEATFLGHTEVIKFGHVWALTCGHQLDTHCLTTYTYPLELNAKHTTHLQEASNWCLLLNKLSYLCPVQGCTAVINVELIGVNEQVWMPDLDHICPCSFTGNVEDLRSAGLSIDDIVPAQDKQIELITFN